MRKLSYLLLVLSTTFFYGQVGINTISPETTFEVVGKADDVNHFDGILPPRITGDQLSKKLYSTSKKGAVVFVTSPVTNLVGQVTNITEPGLYFFDGNLWRLFSKENDPIEYHILLTFDSTSSAGLAATSTWSTPGNQWGNTNAYLTSSKYYTIGTKNFEGLTGYISFKKIHGIVNVHFQLYRLYGSEPITGIAFINIEDICRDLGYFPNQIVLLHTESSIQYFPVLLENFTLQIPKTSLDSISTSSYTYGDAQGYSNWRKPHLK